MNEPKIICLELKKSGTQCKHAEAQAKLIAELQIKNAETEAKLVKALTSSSYSIYGNH
jgi:hypothetical protein